MGGILAMEIIKKVPERVMKIVLMDTNFKSETSETKSKRIPQIKLVNEGKLEAVMKKQILQNYLVKNKNLSFRESYAIAAKLVNYAEKKNKLLSELSLQEIMKIYKNLDKKVLKIFDVNNSMNSKRSHGGTSIANIKSMIKKYKKELK